MTSEEFIAWWRDNQNTDIYMSTSPAYEAWSNYLSENYPGAENIREVPPEKFEEFIGVYTLLFL